MIDEAYFTFLWVGVHSIVFIVGKLNCKRRQLYNASDKHDIRAKDIQIEFMFFRLDRDYVPSDAPFSIHRISRVNELNDAFREERRFWRRKIGESS